MSDIRNNVYKNYRSSFKDHLPGHADGRSEAFMLDARGWLEPLLENAASDDRILDVGCGAGELMQALAAMGFEKTVGVDISQEQVTVAEALGLEVHCQDIFEFSKEQGEASFDFIVAFDLVEHFTKEESVRLMEALLILLKPGGLLLIQTPNGAGLFPGQIMYGDLSHQTIFSPPSLAQLLTMCGYVDLHFREKHTVPMGLKGRIRRRVWKGIVRAANFIRYIECRKSQAIWTENMLCDARRPTTGDSE